MMTRQWPLLAGLAGAGLLLALFLSKTGVGNRDMVMIEAVPAHPGEVIPAVPGSTGETDRDALHDRTWADLGEAPGDSSRRGELLPDEVRPARLSVPPIPEPLPPDPAREEKPPAESAAPVSPPDSQEVAGRHGEESLKEPEVRDAPLIPPVLLKAAWLSYPREALKRKAQATVEVRILVAESGSVSRVELVDGSVDPELGQAAIEAARSMKFRPATRGGLPVPVWYNYLFDFSLPRSG